MTAQLHLGIECIWDGKAVLGEGPYWAEDEQALYWVDIKRHQLFRQLLSTGVTANWDIPEQVTSLAKGRHGLWLATVRDGFAELELSPGRAVVTPICLPETHLPDNRFNDGKVDAYGRYWAGSMDDKETATNGKLYCLDTRRQLHLMDDGYCITNGPTFSPDGKILYHTSTTDRTIFQFDVTSDGRLMNKRPFYVVPEGDGYPDGMTSDAEGCIWLCHFFGWRISRISPAGRVLSTIAMPVSNITSCTFGGPDFEQLFITTARWALTEEQLLEQPQAGGVFSCFPGVKGLPPNRYGG